MSTASQRIGHFSIQTAFYRISSHDLKAANGVPANRRTFWVGGPVFAARKSNASAGSTKVPHRLSPSLALSQYNKVRNPNLLDGLPKES
jgi:hypothetical protein